MIKTFKSKKFEYRSSFKITEWGYHFDSLLELKYAFFIQNEYEFIRSRVTIHYHQNSCRPTDYVRDNVRHYTPDFLIRHKQTGEAFLVEIKPRDAQNESQLVLRQEVAKQYIQWKGYDWKFKIVYDDEIILDEATLVRFKECCKLRWKSDFKRKLAEQHMRYSSYTPIFLARIPSDCDLRFIFFGARSVNHN